MEPGARLFGDVFFVAWKRAEIAQLDTITLSEIAERVGAELGETYAAQTALGWRRGSKPRTPVINAIAKVLGADAALLRAAERGASLPRLAAEPEIATVDPALASGFRSRGTPTASRGGAKSKGRDKKGG
jgi:hypothetical protein